jgi:hypothetical protein
MPDTPMSTTKAVVILLVVIGVIIGIISTIFSHKDANSGDASAHLACQHFRDVADDAANGILSGFELRGKLQEVYGDARYSDSPGIASGAQRMLRDATEGNTTDFRPAVQSFSASCTAAGY